MTVLGQDSLESWGYYHLGVSHQLCRLLIIPRGPGCGKSLIQRRIIMHTNNTSHYNLPQFIGSDIPNPLTDWNDSMQDIDTAMYEIKTQADEIGSDIVQDESDISDLQSQANLTDDNITLLNQQTTAARSAATDAQDAANRNASNIATLQQSVANNRTSITQYNNRFNENVPFAFCIEEVEDPDNPGQTIEKYGYYQQTTLLNTAEYGLPQKRYRIFIFARKKNYLFQTP